MTTIIYLRTSTEEQNPESQLKDCLTLIEQEEYKVYEDKQSAWKENIERINFNKIKQSIKMHQINKLVVWDLDRIYRNRKNLLGFFQFCKFHKCKIISFRQKFINEMQELVLPQGFEFIKDMMIDNFLQFLGWIAEDESQKKSDRVRAAIRTTKDGAYSYRGNKWGRKEISNQAINKILELHQQGKSLREICKLVQYADKNNNMRNVSLGVVHKITAKKHRKTFSFS